MRDSERSENDQYTLTYNEGTQFLRLFFAFLFDIHSRIVREQTETDTLQRKLRYTLTYSEGTCIYDELRIFKAIYPHV